MGKALLELAVFLLLFALDGALINAVTIEVVPPEIDYECGVGSTKLATRITGSATSVAHRNSWPWMALLGTWRTAVVNDEVRTDNRWFCGGVLINDQWVMTAAHCLEDPNLTFFVRLGEHDSSSDADGASPEDYEVESVLPHPSYADIYYDMALVKLKVPVTFSNSISPICLPWKVDRDVTEGDDVYISGWGSTYHGGEGSPVLREAIVKIQNTQKCEENYKGRNPNLFRHQFLKGITDQHLICAGDDKGTDTCQGDSGGPLSMVDPRTGRFVLVGTVSTGLGCGHSELPGLYTNVKSELLWIRRTAFQSSSCSDDSECASNAVCFAGSCVKLCGSLRCGRGALCKILQRRAACYCPDGYDGDPFNSCTRGISSDIRNPCEPNPCAANGLCDRERDDFGREVAVCKCREGFTGDGYESCTEVEQSMPLDADGLPIDISDPCEPNPCAANAVCGRERYGFGSELGVCKCRQGFTGSGYDSCTEVEQSTPSDAVGLSGPTGSIVGCPDVCGPNAFCDVTSGSTFEQSTCKCNESFVGQPPNCRRPTQCTLDANCEDFQRCSSGKCVDPCITNCSFNTICTVKNHTAFCERVVDLCLSNTDCAENEHCSTPGFCQNVCQNCPSGNECIARNHTAICSRSLGSKCAGNRDCEDVHQCSPFKICVDPCASHCPNNVTCFVKNHQHQCEPGYLTPCSNNTHCPDRYQCSNFGRCTDPCTTYCPKNAKCFVTNHQPICEPGYMTPCINNTHCPDIYECSVFGRCIDPCRFQCPNESKCSVINHQPLCEPGYRTRCSNNSQCPDEYRCSVFGDCIDPCSSYCPNNLTCFVRNHQPICEPGLFSLCSNNSHCPEKYRCSTFGNCVDPCESACPPNVKCTVRNHEPHCEKGHFTSCRTNSDCLKEHQCSFLGFCRDPCESFCRSGVTCSVREHIPFCNSHRDCFF